MQTEPITAIDFLVALSLYSQDIKDISSIYSNKNRLSSEINRLKEFLPDTMNNIREGIENLDKYGKTTYLNEFDEKVKEWKLNDNNSPKVKKLSSFLLDFLCGSYFYRKDENSLWNDELISLPDFIIRCINYEDFNSK